MVVCIKPIYHDGVLYQVGENVLPSVAEAKGFPIDHFKGEIETQKPAKVERPKRVTEED